MVDWLDLSQKSIQFGSNWVKFLAEFNIKTVKFSFYFLIQNWKFIVKLIFEIVPWYLML